MEDKEKKEKETRVWVKRFKIAILCTLTALIVLATATYIIFLITHKDKKRNTNVDSNKTTSALIEKNLFEGFNNVSSTGKYSFRLSDEDINQIILNADVKDLLWDKALNLYYDSSDGNHFYVDLKKTLGVKTRVDYSFENVGFTADGKHIYALNTKTMGKLNYFPCHLDVSTFLDKLSEKTGLPISYLDGAYLSSPIEFIEYFPDASVKSYLKELIALKPQCFKLDPGSMFGFDIDFSLFNNSSIPGKETSETNKELSELVKANVTEDFLYSIGTGETNTAYNVSMGDINFMLGFKLDLLENITFTNELTSKEIDIGFDDIYVYIKDSTHLCFIEVLSINGYKLYIENDAIIDLISYPFSLRMGFMINTLSSLNGSTLSKESELGKFAFNQLTKVTNGLASIFSYISYEENDYYLDINLEDFIAQIIGIELYDYQVVVNTSIPNSFDLVFTKA